MARNCSRHSGEDGSYPLLDEFVSFVETKATVYNDSINGGDTLMDPAHTPPITLQKMTSSLLSILVISQHSVLCAMATINSSCVDNSRTVRCWNV